MEFEELRTIIADKLGVEEDIITETTLFREDLAADSVDLAEIVVEVEDMLHIKIPDDLLEEIRTVEDALEVINDAV